MNQRQQNQPTRFTLVEMLVVIATLAILMSLLSPALKRAVDSGHSLSCMNNQKAVHSVFARYAEDYAGLIPATWVRPDASTTGPLPSGTSGHEADFRTGHWAQGFPGMSLIQAYDQGLAVVDWFRWGRGLSLNPNMMGPWNKVYICPSNLNPAHVPNPDGTLNDYRSWWVSEYSRKAISYGLNTAAWYGNQRQGATKQYGRFNPLRLSRLFKPAETVLGADNSMGLDSSNQIHISDSTTFNVTLQTESYTTLNNLDYGERHWVTPANGRGNIMLRHKNQMGFNAFYIDGHVSSFVFPDYPPSLVWNWNLTNL